MCVANLLKQIVRENISLSAFLKQGISMKNLIFQLFHWEIMGQSYNWGQCMALQSLKHSRPGALRKSLLVLE